VALRFKLNPSQVHGFRTRMNATTPKSPAAVLKLPSAPAGAGCVSTDFSHEFRKLMSAQLGSTKKSSTACASLYTNVVTVISDSIQCLKHNGVDGRNFRIAKLGDSVSSN
jgi:hypothetical protein